MAKTIHFQGWQKQAAETSPCCSAVRAGSKRSEYSPHLGDKQRRKLELRGQRAGST